MSVSFKSILDDIGTTIKKVFVKINPAIKTADQVIIAASPYISLIPGFGTMIEGGANVVAQVEATFAAASAQNDTGAQKLALALPLENQVILPYLEQNGLSLKSASSVATITSAIVTILNEFSNKPPAVANQGLSAPVTTASPVVSPTPAV